MCDRYPAAVWAPEALAHLSEGHCPNHPEVRLELHLHPSTQATWPELSDCRFGHCPTCLYDFRLEGESCYYILPGCHEGYVRTDNQTWWREEA